VSAAVRMRIAGILAAALAAALCAPAAAQTLYGAEAPPEAAYVRMFRASGEVPSKPLVLGSARFELPDPGTPTAYRPVSPDIYLIRSGGHTAEIITRAEGYFTVALTGVGIRVFEDPAHEDPARSQLFLYNLSGLEQVSLSTEDGSIRVIGPLSPGQAGTVTVNAVSVPLAVYAGGELLELLGDPVLERGSSYSAFVFERAGTISVMWTEAVLALD